MFSVRLARRLMSLLILVILISAGCQRTQQASETNGSADGADVQISLQPLSLEETLVVILTGADGAPVTDATVAVEGNMNHAGMIPVLADPVADDADGSADGRYHLPFTFTMLGDWIISVTVTQADGSEFTRDLEVQATSDGITGDAVIPAETGDGAQNETSGEGAAHDHEASHDVTHDATGAHAAAMHIHDPMARPAPLAGGTAAVYFLLHNGGDTPVTLLGGETPVAAAVEIHTTINDNGVMRMRQITEGIELGADEAVELSPGALHLMLVDLAAPLVEGETITLTLHFEGAGDFTTEVPVVNMADLPEEGEMEHDH
jgi:copper(I)-binding protein